MAFKQRAVADNNVEGVAATTNLYLLVVIFIGYTRSDHLCLVLAPGIRPLLIICRAIEFAKWSDGQPNVAGELTRTINLSVDIIDYLDRARFNLE